MGDSALLRCGLMDGMKEERQTARRVRWFLCCVLAAALALAVAGVLLR